MAEYISNFSHWTWWILGVILVVVEIAAPGTFFLWMGISAGVVGAVLYFSPSLPWEAQLTIFALFFNGLHLCLQIHLSKGQGREINPEPTREQIYRQSGYD